MMTFLEYLRESEKIANDEVYLSNMSKSFADKAWFIDELPSEIDTIVDFGGGAGEFAEYCARNSGRKLGFIIIDNNPAFLRAAKAKGFLGFRSLDELRSSTAFDPSKTCLVLSSVIHEIYSYSDPFYDDIGYFWSSVKKCGFRTMAIRDMSIGPSAFKDVPVDAVLWVYRNVLKSDTLTYKDVPLKDITDSFEAEWGDICDVETRKVDVKRLIHFLIKYRYQENWKREVRENYLPISQDKLRYWIEDFMGYDIVVKRSTRLDFYRKQWTKDFKLNSPDNGGFKRMFLTWLTGVNTHIKWFAVRPDA